MITMPSPATEVFEATQSILSKYTSLYISSACTIPGYSAKLPGL